MLPAGGGQRKLQVADMAVPELDVHPADALRGAGQIVVESIGEFVADLRGGVGRELERAVAVVGTAAVLRPHCVSKKNKNNKEYEPWDYAHKGIVIGVRKGKSLVVSCPQRGNLFQNYTKKKKGLKRRLGILGFVGNRRCCGAIKSKTPENYPCSPIDNWNFDKFLSKL